HHFLQCYCVPSTSANKLTWNLSTYNIFGFNGRDFAYAKPPGVIRIAALGASTTEDGYPAMLEEYLNTRIAAQSNRFEVMNFGHAYYTSAHVLVNFVLNVIDFATAYVIIHQAANNQSARASEPEFRWVYSH